MKQEPFVYQIYLHQQSMKTMTYVAKYSVTGAVNGLDKSADFVSDNPQVKENKRGWISFCCPSRLTSVCAEAASWTDRSAQCVNLHCVALRVHDCCDGVISVSLTNQGRNTAVAPVQSDFQRCNDKVFIYITSHWTQKRQSLRNALFRNFWLKIVPVYHWHMIPIVELIFWNIWFQASSICVFRCFLAQWNLELSKATFSRIGVLWVSLMPFAISHSTSGADLCQLNKTPSATRILPSMPLVSKKNICSCSWTTDTKLSDWY